MEPKLGLEVTDFSSAEAGFHPRILTDGDPVSDGWRSEPNCKLPQFIIFKIIGGMAKIKAFQFVTHEFLIARKLYIYSSKTHDTTSSRTKWKLHGFLRLNDNKLSGYKARERKTIQMRSEATHLKLEFHELIKNEKNTKLQVGLSSVVLFGQLISPEASPASFEPKDPVRRSFGPGEALPATEATPNPTPRERLPVKHSKKYKKKRRRVRPSPSISPSTTPQPPPAPPVEAPPSPPPKPEPESEQSIHITKPVPVLRRNRDYMSVYTRIEASVAALDKAKAEAVETEDYKAAGRAKAIMNKILDIAAVLEALELQKIQAVKEEDFGAAHTLKEEIQKLRALVNRPHEEVVKNFAEDLFGQQLRRNTAAKPSKPKRTHPPSQPTDSASVPAPTPSSAGGGGAGLQGLGPESIPNIAPNMLEIDADGERGIKPMGQDQTVYELTMEEKAEMERKLAARASVRKPKKMSKQERAAARRAAEAIRKIRGDKTPKKSSTPTERAPKSSPAKPRGPPARLQQSSPPDNDSDSLAFKYDADDLPELDSRISSDKDVRNILLLFPEAFVRAIISKKPLAVKQAVKFASAALNHVQRGGDPAEIEGLSDQILDDPKAALLSACIGVYQFLSKANNSVLFAQNFVLLTALLPYLAENKHSKERVVISCSSHVSDGQPRLRNLSSEQLLMLSEMGDAAMVVKIVGSPTATLKAGGGPQGAKLQKHLEYRGAVLCRLIDKYGLKGNGQGGVIPASLFTPFLNLSIDSTKAQGAREALLALLTRIHVSEQGPDIVRSVASRTDYKVFLTGLEKRLAEADTTAGRPVQLVLGRDMNFFPAKGVVPAHLSGIVGQAVPEKPKTASGRALPQPPPSRPPATAPVAAPASADAFASEEEEEEEEGYLPGMCRFCFWKPPPDLSPEALTEALHRHIITDCPCCIPCPACERIIEIPCLPEHMVVECAANHNANPSVHFSLCPKCRLAFPDAEIEAHIASCAVELDEGFILCPLCHKIIEDGEEALAHYADFPGCHLNPRTTK
eukprot:gnl/Chilomastix_cuspidata/2491.p1 GENE.gnl/Chilomastix_cuspidata/2491~~gnl/Chilomastix_cuspidata/2491.p1  ORF type:complete len:1032 (-),score=263.09 gnl/Chilomastix_cuspidata/2491:269-3340(-)